MGNTTPTPILPPEDRFAFLAEASRLLAESLDLTPTLRTIARLCVPSLADWCAVILVPQEGEPQRVAIEAQTPEQTALAQQVFARYRIDLKAPTGIAEVVRSGEPAFFPDVPPTLAAMASTDEAGRQLFAAAGFVSFMCVPLVARGRAVGTITLGMAESGRHYTREDLDFALEVARRAAVAVDNSQLYASAQLAIAQRDQFLSVASHELKTPITALALSLESLRRTAQAAPEQVAERLTQRIPTITQQLRQLTGLVDRLLDVSQLAEGRLRLERQPVDLPALVREVAERFAERARLARSPLHLDLAPAVVGELDPFRIDQVVTNLLENAIKYGPGQPVDVTLTADADRCILRVHDQGIGIAEADQPRLFGRYQRAAPAHRYGGLGLGLWIAQQIVRSHGGEISVVSAPGQGSTFVVELPLKAPPHAES